MRILALDPATHCGYAFADVDPKAPKLVVTKDSCGVWNLKPDAFDGGGMRYVRIQRAMDVMGPSLVVYERVEHHKGKDAARIYYGIIATIQRYCEERSIPYEALNVSSLKTHATGMGNADKPQMITAAQNLLGYTGNDDNEADALWLLHWEIEQMKGNPR